MAISQHHQEQTPKSNLKENVDSIVMENKKLRNFNENVSEYPVTLQKFYMSAVYIQIDKENIQYINECFIFAVKGYGFTRKELQTSC